MQDSWNTREKLCKNNQDSVFPTVANSLKMEHSKTNFGWMGSQQKGLKMSWLHWLMKFPQCVLMGETLREQLKLLTYLKCIYLKELCGFPPSATTACVVNPSILTP
uniref:Uncharacterized protein n=1 Tax=Micrurus corallinus TaxID=54390 RepID=A0A2D4G0G0_MICCO